MPPERLPETCHLKGQHGVTIYAATREPATVKNPYAVRGADGEGKETWLELQRSENRLWLNGEELNPAASLKTANHSPDGFNWGYSGSGPAQAALAICLELYGVALAQRVYQQFKFMFVARLPQGKDFEDELELTAFNAAQVIPAMEELKQSLLFALDEAKADIEFLEWLPSNTDNFETEGYPLDLSAQTESNEQG